MTAEIDVSHLYIQPSVYVVTTRGTYGLNRQGRYLKIEHPVGGAIREVCLKEREWGEGAKQ